jgi:RND family efflux transporter MFP subunit
MMQLNFLNRLISKRLVYGLIAAVVGAGVIGGSLLWTKHARIQPAAEELTIVRTAVIGSAGAAQGYTYSGEVRGRYESQLAFQVNGKIIKRNVQLGSVVNAGDVLMQLDAKGIVQTVNSNSAQIYSAESQLQLAESNLKRYGELVESGAISQSQYDQYLTAYHVAIAGVRQAQAQYTQGANQLDYSLLCADKPGVIASISAETGQVVSAGQPVITVVHDGEREIEISVPENRIEELRTAKEVKVAFWALSNVTVQGTVREIAPMADQTTRTFKVRISLINPPPEIKLGMTAAVTLTGNNRQQAIHIPLSAIYQKGDFPAVWVVSGDILTLRSVKTGDFGNGTIQILEGLQQGERIVTAGVHKLNEGQKIRVGGDSL